MVQLPDQVPEEVSPSHAMLLVCTLFMSLRVCHLVPGLWFCAKVVRPVLVMIGEEIEAIICTDRDKAGPFFLIVYADDEIVVARGRGGGIALWQRTTPAFELKAGISL